jgi:transcriptional regulator with XRE-family HTH domain
MPKYGNDQPNAGQVAMDQADRLRWLREAVAPSQAAVCRAVGLSKDSWNRMETGERRIDALTLAMFGRVFSVSTEYVVSGEPIGLPRHVLQLVLALEQRDAAGGRQEGSRPARTPEPSGASSSDTSPGRSMPGKAKRASGRR